MSKIEEIVDALENKISKILHKQEVLKQTNEKLTQKLQDQERQLLQYQEDEFQSGLKNTKRSGLQTMLGSDENKRETKLKINALIRDIDHCIAQLSE
jgi:hypothetical protein